MTEPTWKDPLLASMTWSEVVSEDIQTWPYAPRPEWPALAVYDWLAKNWPNKPDTARLRSLIDAELARGREAVEVLRELEWSASEYHEGDSTCPDCGCYHPASRLYDRSDVGHAPDCRLAKVIR